MQDSSILMKMRRVGAPVPASSDATGKPVTSAPLPVPPSSSLNSYPEYTPKLPLIYPWYTPNVSLMHQ